MSEQAQPMPRALSGAQLRTLAANGGFAVDETTGNQMIEALESVLDTLNARWPALQRLAEPPPMSSTATARWVAEHMLRTGTDERGLLTQLRHAREEFPAYIEAIRLAKQNYRSRDEETRHALARFRAEA